MRFHGMSAPARKDRKRAENAAQLMEWFGGRAEGEYRFQKLLFLDGGAGFGNKPLFKDPEIRAVYGKSYGSLDMIEKQQALARKKDVIAPWYGEWDEVNGTFVAGGHSAEGEARGRDEEVRRQVDAAQEGGGLRPRSHGDAVAAPRGGVLLLSSSFLSRRFTYEQRSAVLLVLPVMVVLMGVAVFPIVHSLYTSFFDLKLTRPHRVPFVGFDNYVAVLTSETFWAAVARTAWFTLLSVSATSLVALLVALLLNEAFRGRRFLAAMILAPWAIPTVAKGLMWQWIYDSGYGVLNGILYQLGLIDRYMVWLGDARKTMGLIVNAFVWKEVPLAAILLLVTMKSIPVDLYRAAKVDGAHVLNRFFHVTLPSLRPGFLLVVIYEAMMAIRHFDLFFILTHGGPGDTSSVLAWQIYVETFRNLSFGTGSALAYVMAIATFGLAYFVVRVLGRRL
jgi:ABC-type sugar transport system permease subunit